MPNRLAASTSPYLLQHADNPVDWQEWGAAAFAEARQRDVPVFLSIGYSSCHWCHVMAHESFEDDEVAAVLNERFVSVKVDREERPDVDAVYMDATVALTGRGGWPMSVFLDHDAQPFLAGTYWPKHDRGQVPGFLRVLETIHDAWTTDREQVMSSAAHIATTLAAQAVVGGEAADVTVDDLAAAARLLTDRAWDRNLGGFGQAPKFPQAMTIGFLLDHASRTGDATALEAACHSLDAMARGGIHDQVGGGFARYSTDAQWLAPHFEKMLTDQALLVEVYARAAVQDTDADRARSHRRVATRIAAYLAAEMTTVDGGFFAATDADSEGVEGRFFTWSHEEYAEVVEGLGLDVERFAAFHDVSEAGNWEHQNILRERQPRGRFCRDRGLDLAAFEEDLSRVEAALYDRRSHRVAPGLDDKVLTNWNGLTIRGLARAGVLLDDDGMIAQASAAAGFLLDHHVRGDVVWHTSKGRSGDDQEVAPKIAGFLDDLVWLADGLLALYEATGEVRWFTACVGLVERAVAEHREEATGQFVQTAITVDADEPELYVRPRARYDNATPSSTAVLAGLFTRLFALTGELAWRDRLDDLLAHAGADVARNPAAHGELLRAHELAAAGMREVAIVGPAGPERDALVAELRGRVLPATVVAISDLPLHDGAPALLRGRGLVDGRPAAYVCREMVCERPITTPADLGEALAR